MLSRFCESNKMELFVVSRQTSLQNLMKRFHQRIAYFLLSILSTQNVDTMNKYLKECKALQVLMINNKDIVTSLISCGIDRLLKTLF